MIAKEISDLENDNELKWDLEVPKYNVFTDTFYFKWTSNGAELMPCGTHGYALKSTKLPRLMGFPNNPGEGGTLRYASPAEYRFDSPTLEKNTEQSL